MRSALRKPRRVAPTLLSIPNRERIVGLLQRCCLVPHTLIAVELERRPTLEHGDVAVLTVFAAELGRDKIEHVMPGEFTVQQLEGAAQILGQTLAMVIRKKEAASGRRQGIARSVQ
jgi:hypothetical protein